jgi:hypothetical protein
LFAVVTVMPRTTMAAATAIVVLYVGAGLLLAPVIDTDSAIAFTICADGEEIMFPNLISNTREARPEGRRG